MKIFCGIDFGTTNTVVSITGRERKLVDSFSIPTTLFIPYQNQGIDHVLIGEQALRAYEEGRRGRYIHSIKRSLSDPYLRHTTINRTYVKLENIICLFLNELKKVMENRWSFVPQNIMLGRPVKFSLHESENKMANERLLESFKLAGFKRIIQLAEPVAASLCFENEFTSKDRSFMIMDLGGGTSDFSLIERHQENSDNERFSVKSIGGIDIGGDIFDEILMHTALSPLLGLNSTFESFGKRLPMPAHLYNEICRWNSMHLFDKKKLSEEFRDYLFHSDDPIGVLRLRAIIENNLSHRILYKVRDCKHELGIKKSGRILFNELGLGLDKSLRLDQFSQILEKSINQIVETMKDTAGGEIELQKIDRFILTGGSSRVLKIGEQTESLVSGHKILKDTDFYNSVSKGLSLYAFDRNLTIMSA